MPPGPPHTRPAPPESEAAHTGTVKPFIAPAHRRAYTGSCGHHTTEENRGRAPGVADPGFAGLRRALLEPLPDIPQALTPTRQRVRPRRKSERPPRPAIGLDSVPATSRVHDPRRGHANQVG